GAPREDGPLADRRPQQPPVRRPRPARLLLPRELVALARHHDPREDSSGRLRAARRLLSAFRPNGHESRCRYRTMARPEEASELKAWEQWYRLARHSLACRHAEAVQYANLRFVEEQN